MLLFAIGLAAASIPAEAANPPAARTCPRTTVHYAWDPSKPVTPRKLTELPPGIAYMAVYRRINQCEAPMTMVEYRSQGRSR